MANILDYMDWRGDLDFAAAPCNEVDNLILSQLCYLNFDGVAPEHAGDAIPLSLASQRYFQLRPWKKRALGVMLSDQIQDLLLKAGNSRRFGGVRLWGHVNHVDPARETQFSATCFSLGSSCTFVAFRGTDDTIAGWKEDFNMAFTCPVPAQSEAVRYLEQMAGETDDLLLLGGHSKGGNLSVYAAAFCSPETQERIRQVWSNDGPGFFPELLASPQYRAIRERVCSIVPRSSLVGVILDSDCETVTIESSAVGPLQHDGLTWQVLGSRFVRAEGMSKSSKRADHTLDTLMREMEPEHRKKAINALFSATGELGVSTLSELLSEGRKLHSLRAIHTALSGFEKETREQFLRALLVTLREDEGLLRHILPEKEKEKDTTAP